MKLPLYSDSHVPAAKILFPNRTQTNDWYHTQWLDEEINACKAIEMEKFINNPCLKNYPLYSDLLTKNYELKNHTSANVEVYLKGNIGKKLSLLSIGLSSP